MGGWDLELSEGGKLHFELTLAPVVGKLSEGKVRTRKGQGV